MLGSLILYLKAIRIVMFQLSGFYYMVCNPVTHYLGIWSLGESCSFPDYWRGLESGGVSPPARLPQRL